MAASNLSQCLTSKNILSSLNGLSLTGLVPGSVHALALLSDQRKFDEIGDMYPVDRVRNMIFRKCSVDNTP